MDKRKISVTVRVRPTETDISQISDNNITIGDKTYSCDRIYRPEDTQSQVFESAIKPLIESFSSGFNSTVIAYGQTGSGKTYTMGISTDSLAEFIHTGELNEQGVVIHALSEIFKAGDDSSSSNSNSSSSSSSNTNNTNNTNINTNNINTNIDNNTYNLNTYNLNTNNTHTTITNNTNTNINKDRVLKMTFMEIYNEKIFDLFTEKSQNLKLQEKNGRIEVGLKEIEIRSISEAINLLKSAAKKRTTKLTDMNESSSRSHAVLTIIMQGVQESRLSFIDLAGSERMKRTNCTGQRARESISINSGLLALGNVITALYKGHSYVPYRQSKLTRILQPFLGGNCRTLMIACVNPGSEDVSETHNTMKYATRASHIQNSHRRETVTDPLQLQILNLKREVMKLKAELNVYKNKENRASIEKSREEVNNFYEETFAKNCRVRILEEENQKLKVHNKKLQEDYLILKSKSQKKVTFDLNDIESQIHAIQAKNLLINKEYDILNTENAASNSDSEYSPKKKVFKVKRFKNSISSSMINSIDGNSSNSISNNSSSNNSNSNSNSNNIRNNSNNINSSNSNSNSNSNNLNTIVNNTRDMSIDKILTGHKGSVMHLKIKNKKLISSSFDNTIRSWDIDKEGVDGNISDKESIKSNILDKESMLNKILINTKSPVKLFEIYASDILFADKNKITTDLGETIFQTKSEISAAKVCENKIFLGSNDGNFAILDLDGEKKVVFSKKIHRGTINDIIVDGESCYTASRDHTVSVVGVNSIYLLTPPHYDSVTCLAVTDTLIISGSRDCSIKIWEKSSRKHLFNLQYAHDNWIKVMSHYNNYLYTGSKDGVVKMWEIKSGTITKKSEYKIGSNINCMIYSNNFLFVGCINKKIYSFNVDLELL